MPKRARRPPELAGKMFRGSYAVAQGLLTKGDLRSTAWQKVFNGVYADAQMELSHYDRCLAASRFLLPPEAAIAGRSAAILHGVPARQFGTGDQPVEVITPRATRIRATGVAVRLARLDEGDVEVKGGIRITRPARTCWDLTQRLDVIDAVPLLDAYLARPWLLTRAAIEAYARQRASERGSRKLSRAIALADPNAESPQESRVRVKLVLAGVPRPVSQYVIRHRDQFVARTDLAWPECRVAVEYDGVWHSASGEQIHADRRRLNRLAAAGWVVLHVTAKRLREDFDGFLAELRALLRSRRALRPA